MVAYHFPPLAGSSGIQRTLRFVQHLPDLGWEPLVLTANARAYEQTSGDLLSDVPASTVVQRAFALDTARHLQVAGRYLGFMARPDRWVSWKFAAIRDGLRMIEKYKPEAIWSTYPIATAHVIASALSQKSGLPWIADFRDPMAQDGYPVDPLTHKAYEVIEADAAKHARFCVFTTPGAARIYQERFPAAADRMVVLENGYDEESFVAAAARKPATAGHAASKAPLIMLHSGIVYPSERDPTQLFAALAQLQRAGDILPSDMHIRFRASVHDGLLTDLAKQFGVSEFIELCPPVPYLEALSEMGTVDALLVMQASNCNQQIPAKIYEYLRAGKPILGLTDPIGDTAAVLRNAGLTDHAALDSADEIASALKQFVAAIKGNSAKLPDPASVRAASRRGRSESLVKLLEQISSGTK